MIDTPQKRMGVFQVSGLMTPPFPRGVVDAPDRQQMSDIYPGLLAAQPRLKNETCWIPSKSNVSIWVAEEEVVPCAD